MVSAQAQGRRFKPPYLLNVNNTRHLEQQQYYKTYPAPDGCVGLALRPLNWLHCFICSQCQSSFCPPWQERQNSSCFGRWESEAEQLLTALGAERAEWACPWCSASHQPAPCQRLDSVSTTGHKLGTRRSTHNPVVDISDSNITVTVEGKVKKPFTRNHVLLFPVSSCYELRVGVDYCLKETEGNLDRKKIS